MLERRAAMRVSCFLPAEYRLSDGTSASSGRVTNLSVHGLGLLTSTPLHPGNRLTTHVALPTDGASLELDGLVRWSMDSPGRDGSYLAGVEFERLDDTARFCLQHFIADPSRRALPSRAIRFTVLLLGMLLIAGLSLWVLILQRKNEQLVQALAERTVIVTQLEARQQQLQEQLTQTGLRALDSAAEVERLQRQAARLETEIGWLSQNLRDLKGAYERVRSERMQLEQQQAELSRRLSSIPALRQAMREAVRLTRQERRQARASRRRTDRTITPQDNRGYVVYAGVPTLTSASSRLSIRVLTPEPLAPSSER